MAKLTVEFLDDAAFDSLQRLPEPHLDVAWELLEHLREHPFFGKPLQGNAQTGELSGTRSLYVIDFDHERIDWPPPCRIVHRLLPSERDARQAQVIWAGQRDDLLVYRTAIRRLRLAAEIGKA
jgi:hypothetical protein